VFSEELEKGIGDYFYDNLIANIESPIIKYHAITASVEKFNFFKIQV
jgi:hypothetical protein